MKYSAGVGGVYGDKGSGVNSGVELSGLEGHEGIFEVCD